MYKGIDISSWQGNVDFKKVKAAGIDFVLLRAGGSDSGFYTDPYFKKNIQQAHEMGLDVGAYYFVGKYCKSADAGLNDAKRFHEIIKDYQLEYPVYIDFEAPDHFNKQGNTDACKAFCEYMEGLGYYVGIYASDISGFQDKLNIDQLTAYDKWVACWGASPSYVKSWGVWQFTNRGSVSGVSGRVDRDYSRNNYPQIMRTHHLNGF